MHLSPYFNPGNNHFGRFGIVKNKLTSTFYADGLLLMLNSVIRVKVCGLNLSLNETRQMHNKTEVT